jgi:hypothetical protein
MPPMKLIHQFCGDRRSFLITCPAAGDLNDDELGVGNNGSDSSAYSGSDSD